MQIRTPLALFFAAAVARDGHVGPRRDDSPTPKPLMPAPGAPSETIPVFGWSPVANADHYEFQVAADSGFNSPVIGSNEDHFVTRNARATLKRTIPNGTYYWRVRAITKAGASRRGRRPSSGSTPGRGPPRSRRRSRAPGCRSRPTR